MDKPDHKKIGLLGGSFNPAHEGHLEISLKALEILGLDEIWWLVSPGNPLKSDDDMAEYNERFLSAERIAGDHPIIISDIEKKFKTRYTVDTLTKLTDEFDHDFIWLMGADNLAQFDKWKDWKDIANTVPFAIFNRPSYSVDALNSIAAKTLSEYKIPTSNAAELYMKTPPAWVYYEMTENPMSSTEIRRNNKRLQT
ncbi:nicotinate-nucleotide adenylyltransferase [Pseudemcibacter aquimaris]|uniref:nicotinate-nucleotide adenylyltransferase n=1 Tax=Pseudemcibacter aquimaris TaxID=2857064 RepID=UPI0020134D19|nr:nicotinate-nucleotide adenylyltransferase [Pseudemcibacter aquimaris]MCC3861633.1 nicotinate-nucleotide adenylyltransferase [Pseudemcibacter aquimaris]WDU58404.1 nicotinate-nucleotide adenylyltransferase [Pseudemcibacter aquimaris]